MMLEQHDRRDTLGRDGAGPVRAVTAGAKLTATRCGLTWTEDALTVFPLTQHGPAVVRR